MSLYIRLGKEHFEKGPHVSFIDPEKGSADGRGNGIVIPHSYLERSKEEEAAKK